jgi:hypothetical protein
VYVGSYFYPEGKTGATGVNYAEIGGDFTLEYLATLDGRYRLSFFRRDTYEDIFEGQVTEMGGSVITRKDFNRLRELFHKTKIEKDAEDKNSSGHRMRIFKQSIYIHGIRLVLFGAVLSLMHTSCGVTRSVRSRR